MMELYDSARYGSVFGNIFLSTEASDPGDGGPGPAGPKKDSKAALLLEPTLDRYEVAANASRFAVYHAVRSIVLERETTTRGTVASMRIIDTALDEPKSIGSSSAQAGAGSRVPQIVLAGLDSLYGIIAETRHSQPRIATKALRSLYDILQGQVPEGMRHEPDAVFGPLFDLLLELATTTSPSSTAPGAWSSLACSTLLSLAIAKGDTGRIVRAVAAILMSSAHGSATGGSFNAGGTGAPGSGCVQMPQSVAKLQRTVFSMATGRATIADYFRCGIPRGCLIGEFRLPLESSTVYSVASDGKFLYLVTAKGVLKIGSGFSGTQEGLIYGAVTIAMAKNELPGWIGYAGGKLYYGRISKGNVNNGWTFQLYDPTTLTALGTVQTAPIPMLQRRFGQLFSDGDAICWLGAVSDSLRDGPEVEDQEEDILVVKQLYPPAPSAQPGSIPGASDVRPELRLKLAKNRYHTYGWAAFEEELGENSATAVGAGVPGAGPHSTTVVSPPILDGGNPQQGGSIQSISCGKEFGLVLVEDGSVSGGKVFYWGRSTALGLKLSVSMAGASGCVMGAPKATVTMKLTELTALPKGISYFRQVAVGHEANHGLLLTNDGTVYFTGTAKRGEDGELAKTNRRQPKAIKPKRLNKLDGHSVTFVACNNGTSAFVTKEGKLIMYGKDTNYCEPNGVVGGLADVVIRKVALGKAHCVAVDALGQLYTFGLNNKGQCGRKFQRERNADETVTANNPSVITNGQPSSMPPSTGSTCNACHAVTMAPSTLEPPATATPTAAAATKCGCGCGCCCHCGGNGTDRNAPNTVAPLSSNDADTPRIVPVPPQRVDLPHSGPDSRRAPIVTQIACGQHHSLVLTSSGEVFSFGSNQYGQLGTGDLQAPAGGRPHLIRFPSGAGTAVSVAAGSNHSVVLSSRGAVFTFGNYHKGQLGREAPDVDLVVGGSDSSSNFFWHCAPMVIDSFGPGTGRRASWIAASGDQTYIKVEESLINGAALAKYSVTADRSTILLIPSNQPHLAGSITIDRRTGHCRAHRTNQFDARLELNGGPQPVLKEMYRRARWHFSFTLDPLFNVLWGYDAIRKRMLIFNPIAAELYRRKSKRKQRTAHEPSEQADSGADRNEAGGSARFGLGSATEPLTVLSPEIALPQRWQGSEVPRFQLALNLLACLDVLTEATERLGASGQWPPFEPGTGLDGGLSAAAGSNASPLDGNVNVNASEWFTGTRGVFCGSSSGRQVKLCDVAGDDEPQEEELPEQSNQRSALLTPTFGSIDEEPSAIAPSNRWNLPPSEGVHVGEGRFPFRSGRSKTPASGALNAGVQYRRKKSSLGSGGSSATGSTAGGGAGGMFQSSSNVDESIVSLCPISRRFATGINRETLESLTELLGWAWNAFRNLSGDQKKGSRNSGSAANPGLSANGLFGEAKLIVRLSFICRACLRLLRRYLNAIYHPTGSRGTGADELDGGCSDGHSVDDPLGRSSDLAAAPSFGSQQHHATSYSPMSSSAIQLPTAATSNHQSLAVAVIEIRTLLIDILADRGATAAPLVDRSMRRRIGRAKREVLAECHRTFVRCFDIFYPTPPLKWEILCRRLLLLREACDPGHVPPGKPVERYRYSYGSNGGGGGGGSSTSGGGSHGGRLLLSAILAGLCQPSVNLRVTFSILSATPSSSSVSSSRPASGSSGAMLAIARNRDLLASLIEQMTSGGTTAGSVEGSVGPAQPHLPDWHFRDVLELLLELVSDPVRRKLDRIGRHRRRGSSSSGNSSNSNTSSDSSCRSSEGVEYDYELDCEDDGPDADGRTEADGDGGGSYRYAGDPACDSDADEDDSEQDEDEQQLQQQDDDDEQSQERLLIRNGCRLLAKLLSEIIHHGCDPIEQQQRGAGSDRGGDHHRGGDREEEPTQTAAASDLMAPPGLLAGSNRLYSTGSRFGKIDLGKTWNTGNFGPDAIAFTVDRGGISIAGACVYSGSGSYEYQLELLYDSHHSTHAHSYSHSHRWEVLESIVGSYDQTAVRQHVAELRFNRAVLLKENHRYALRLCSQGARTLSGDCGQSSLRGPCGTVTFRFYPCDLSFNGTTPARGQIPAILYYSTPGGAGGPGSFQLGGAAAPVAGGGRAGELGNGRTQARDLALEVARAIVGRCRELLTVAHELALWTSASGGGLRAPSSTETSSTPSSSASSGVVGIIGGGVLGGPAAATAAGGGVAIDSEHNITPIEEHLDVGSLSTTTGLVSVIASNAASTTIERTRRTIGKVLPKGLLETLRGASGTGPSAAPYDPYEIDSASEATPAAGPVPIGGPGGGMLANGNEMELPASGGGAGGVVMATPIRKRTVWDLFRSRTTRCPSVVNCLFRYLLPLTLAQLERCIRMDLKVAVEVLSMVQEILPPITALNELRRQQQPSSGHPSALKTVSSIGATTITSSATSTNTTSQHYCILESDHPYRTAGITAYRVRFPSSVRWMCLSFDAQCGTVQEEDRVKVKIPNRGGPERDKDGSPSCAVDDWVTVRMYNTPSRWSYGGPGRSMVLPGREVEISLESCSTYVAEPKHPAYGFRCLVIGYENVDQPQQQQPQPVMLHPDHQHPVTAGGTLIALEQELAHLGGRCSRNLLRKELRFDDDPDDRLTEPEVATLERYGGSLLAKGLMVPDAMLTIRNALDCHLPVLEKNYEKQFLRDFIYVAAGSPGARLAAWLQPESRLDPSRCEIKIISPQSPPLRAGWPSHFRLETRDQYGEEIFVPGIKIEVKASLRRDTSVSALTPKVSPGTPTTAAPPTIPYEPTYKEKEKSCLQAISAMRPYHGYSFEELRLYAANMSSTSPSTAATTEILTANDLGKNKYGFVWTPMVAGAYELTLQIDGVPVVVEDEEEIYRLEVIDAGGAAGAGVGTGGGGAGGSGVSGVTPKMLSGEKGAPGGAGQGLKKVHPPTKLRKFLAKNSAGLRVRLHPTLQSEQIGVVRPNGIVAYGDELENDDGVWVRLTAESIREHCPASWFPVEAWCLQYNQHLGKTLLHPIVDPCSTKALLEHTAAKEEPAVAVADEAEDIEADDCEAEEEEDGEENENTINYGDFRKVASAALSEVVGGGAKALQKWFHRTGTDGTGPLLDEQPSPKPVLLPATPLNQPQSVAQQQQQQQQDQQSSQHLPKRALSPSVAETLRAVFAAFLWHEGLVHDAMACASFLKFHPTISKTAGIGGPLAGANGSLGIGGSQPAPEPTTVLTREQKVLQRHSVELSNATLDALERSGNRCIINRRHRGGPFSFVEAAGAGGSSGSGSGAGSAAVPPVALRCLVHLWDQLGSNFVQLVETNSNDKRNDDGQGPKEFPPTTATGPGSTGAGGTAGALVASKSGVTLAASAATGAGGVTQPSSTAAPTNGGSGPADGSYCELCRTVLHSIPVTYHMRLAHPGCGRPAGGQGYNSNGVYCEGWAGDCGDGGHGVSSWYLLCDGCRKRYEGTTPVPLPVPALGMGPDHRRTTEPPRSTLPSELFAMMKENAFFLLDLAPVEQSASGGGGSASSSGAGAEGSLTEVTDASEWPTPPERPACLGTFIDTADMAGQATTTSAAPSSAGRFPADHGFPLGMPGGKFHRSVSMGQGAVGPSVVLRRRQRRDDERSEANLLNHPSENLRRLVPLDGTPYHGPVTASDGTVGLLGRPAMVFILERHNLERMRRLLIRQLRRSLCHRYSLQAFNWLLRQLTEPIGLHDVMWWFVSALTASDADTSDPGPDVESELGGLEHPASTCEGHLGRGISRALHAYLSTVSELTLHFPLGSPLQRIAVQCFGLRFVPSDHQFLHRVNVFGNISRILSKSEEEEERALEAQSVVRPSGLLGYPADDGAIDVTLFQDVTDAYELTVSSRPALAPALLDSSTETFWESDEEDRGKPKTIELVPGGRAGGGGSGCHLTLIAIHVDNSRDVACKVTSLLLYGGSPSHSPAAGGELSLLRTIDIDPAACAWQAIPVSSVGVAAPSAGHYRLEVRGPDATLRIRQVKLYGTRTDNLTTSEAQSHAPSPSPRQVQSRLCEQETLRVFRLLTGQVFGKLLEETSTLLGSNGTTTNGAGAPAGNGGAAGEVAGGPELSPLPSLSESIHDLREHAVGILFSRRKLSHLQKQIIVHVVQAIERETVKARDAWEAALNEDTSGGGVTTTIYNDAYCFEMLSMVLALSGSSVGRTYLSQQHHLLKDLLSLAHTGSDRVQRQVMALIRRILPELPSDTHLTETGTSPNPSSDSDSEALLDVLLALIAKSLQVQVKVKNGANGQHQTVPQNVPPAAVVAAPAVVSLANVTPFSPSHPATGNGCANRHQQRYRWYLRGSIAAKQAESIIALVRDMASGKLSERWATVSRAAVASCLLSVTQLDEDFRRSADACIRTATLWLAMAALCVIDKEQIERLSTNQWHRQSESNRPLCSNHDDDVTFAVLNCALCGSLCADCDRVLHLNRRTRNHHRTVCKEEQDAIRVELHESCGRAKLYWLWAVVDSRTLKGMLEFRGHDPSASCAPVPVTASGVGVCRFCGTTGSSGLLALGNICPDAQCQEYGAVSCTKVHSRCGHACGGIINEMHCLPCLVPNCQSDGTVEPGVPRLTQDGEDMCMICFTETLGTAPSLQLRCGHVFHYHCCKTVLMRRWNGPRISFGFAQCPICKVDIEHPSLELFLAPIVALRQDVKRKALMRLEYEGLAKAVTADGTDPTRYAMERYAYYVCSQCGKAYYGGEARCDAELGENFNPQELVCGGCSDVSKAKMCPKHGMDFLEYKCRYCCSVAVFFCFGTTHFCDTCHDDFQRLTNLPKGKLPRCPAGPKASQLAGEECPLHVVHPPTGEEFALGCGICRNAQTF